MNLILKLLIYLMIIKLCSNFETLEPSLTVMLLIHPYNKINILPFTLSSIEKQIYPKQRINIYINTENLDSENSNEQNEKSYEQIKKLNQLSLDIIKNWIKANRDYYNDIDFIVNDCSIHSNRDANNSDIYWTLTRYKHIVKLKSKALAVAQKNWSDFVLFIDADVVLVNENTFSWMTVVDDKHVIAIAPMLYSLGTYSNFWAGITDRGYYKRTPDYIPILERQRIGIYEVPMIHSCVFINLRYKVVANLTFDSTAMKDTPYDDIIAFAISAKNSGISLYIDNREIWGYIPPPIDAKVDLSAIEEDVIDLELESLVEGPSFPLSSQLNLFVNRPKADKLNVDNIYLINLVRRIERRERMLKCFEILGIEAQVWNGIDGKQLSEQIIVSKGIEIMKDYVDPYHKRPITYGEIGCFLSHFTIWQHMVENNFSKVIVFEDDVRFERRFKYKWNKALSTLDTNRYDFVYLGRKLQGNNQNESHVAEMFVEPAYSYWTIGYMITKRGAQKLLDANPLKQLIPVDEFIPIMFDRHNNDTWKQRFPKRDLRALSLDPLLIYPTHYVGDVQYISDTEDSDKMIDYPYFENHPKHTEF